MSTPAKADALKMLAAENAALVAMFRDYERSKKTAASIEKGKQALRICHRLSIQCAIKEEFFYSAAASALGEGGQAMLDQSRARQGEIRGQIDKIENMKADELAFDPALKTLGELARTHFKDEEDTLFPKLRHSGFDLMGTGEKLETRRLQLSTTPARKADVQEARRVLGS
jgi:hypothetical protein